MLKIRHCVSLALALTLLAACAGRGAATAGGEPEYSGIQTSSMQTAPKSQAARNDSRPLSELNTPDAIAARESAARNSRSAPPLVVAKKAALVVATAAVSAAPHSVAAAVDAALAANNPHQKNASLQKGSTVRVRSDASLRARPNASSESVPVGAAAQVELGPQIYNAGGYWWYVTAGKESGWILQSDLLP